MIEYLIESTISLTLLYVSYHFLLKTTISFKFNRFFLLFAVTISLIIPIIEFTLSIPNNILEVDESGVLRSLIIENEILNYKPIHSNQEYTIINNTNTSYLLIGFYSFVSFILFIRFLRNLIFLFFIPYKNTNKFYRNTKVVLLDIEVAPFSFLNSIFVNRHDYISKSFDEDLLDHEIAHIKEKHSIDIIIMEVIQILYWFNPLIYFFKHSIKANHEFLADNYVLNFGIDKVIYSHKLINLTFRNKCINLASGFNNSLTKRRIIMITKKFHKVSKFKLIIVFTIVLLNFLAFTLSKSQDLSLSGKQKSPLDKENVISKDEIIIEALIDGNTELHVFENGIIWFSKGVAKPGKHHGRDEPTWVNSKQWLPKWGDPTRTRGYDISGLYKMNIGPLDGYKLEMISVGQERNLQGIEERDPVSLIHLVDRIIVKIPDKQSDSRWYKFKLYK